jgi:predicted nucleotidyltransferase
MAYQLRPDAARTARLEQAAAQIVARLAATNVQLAVVFGSLARGEAGPGSDLDLLLVRSTAAPFIRRADDLAEALDVSVALDVLVYTPEEFATLRVSSPFVREALATGRTIYEAGSAERGQSLAAPG